MSIKRVLILLLTIAAILRIASCGKYMFMDEVPIFWNTVNFFKNRTLIPSHFAYPTLFSYLSAVPIGIGAIVLHLRGILLSPTDIGGLFALDSVLPILPARFISVVFGIATILLVFKIGEKFLDRKTGLIAVAFLSFSNLHIFYSGYALPEVTMTFFATCSLFFSLSALKTKSIRDFILAGVFAGFTASTKYNGALIILPIISVYLIHLYDEKRWLNRYIILSAFACICAFLIGSPGWLLSPNSFWNAFVYERAHMATGHLGNFGMPYVHHLRLFWCWERTIAIFFGLGLLYAIFRHNRQDLILLALILPSFLYIGSWQKKDLHYLIFLYPVLALLSARLLSEIQLKLNKRVANVSIFIVVFIWPIYSSVIYAYKQTLDDSRWVAYRWIQNNIPERSKIIVDWAYLPKLLSEHQKSEMMHWNHKEFYMSYLKDIHTYELIPLEYDSAWLSEIQVNYLITSSYCFDRFFYTLSPSPDNPLSDSYNRRKATYGALFYNEKELGWKLLKEFYTGKGPRILIYKRNLIWQPKE